MIQTTTSTGARLPWHITLFGPLLNWLLAVGVPMGPNRLITIRGRRSGLPRTTGVAVIEANGRKWVWCPWGEANWVRNLRTAGTATLTKRGRKEEVTATELDQAGRVDFFRDVLAPLAGSIPFGLTLARLVDGVDLRDPFGTAEGRPVFELHPVG